MDNYSDNFDEIISILKEGKIILYPTDTLWGLGCDALNPETVNRIYEIKNRPPDKSFVLLVSDIEMLKLYVKEIHPRVETLLAYHTRPLTVIYKAKKILPDILLDNGKVAIRIVQEKKISELIKKFGKPIVSIPANISDEPLPENFNEINDKLKSSVDYVFFHKRNSVEPQQSSAVASFSKSGKLKFHK